MPAAQDVNAVPTHLTHVVRAERVDSSFVHLTFGGGLDGFQPMGFEDYVYLLVPAEGRTELPVDTSFTWPKFFDLPLEVRPRGNFYTVRRFRPEAGEVDCEVYIHEPLGAISSWALNARPGDPVALWGPRTYWDPNADTTEWLLVADETGIPALRAILEHRPASLPARVVVEVARDGDRYALPTGDGVEVSWIGRNGRDAGTTKLLVDAVRRLTCVAPTTYAWGGAESRAVSAVRRYLRLEVGLGREQVSMQPYWRHDTHLEDPMYLDD